MYELCVKIIAVFYWCLFINIICLLDSAVRDECDKTISGNTSGSPNTLGNTAGDFLYKFTTMKFQNDATFMRFNSCNSDFDTYLRVFNSKLTREVCGCDDCGGCGTRAVLDCNLAAETDYVLVVEGYSRYSGAFTVDVSCTSMLCLSILDRIVMIIKLNTIKIVKDL